MKINSLQAKIYFIDLLIYHLFQSGFQTTVMPLKMLKAKRWKQKMLGICKRCHFVLLESTKFVNNDKNM